MEDPGEVAAALRGTVLDGHPVQEGLGGTLLVDGVEPEWLLDAWRAARSVVGVTGRWPVLTGVGELYDEPTAGDVAELERAATSIDPWPSTGGGATTSRCWRRSWAGG
jgi:hypothetical protein